MGCFLDDSGGDLRLRRLRIRLPPGLRRWTALLRRLGDAQPLTWRGAAVTALAGLALWQWGYGSLDLLVFVIGVGGLCLVLLAAFLVSGAAIYLRRQPQLRQSGVDAQRLEAGSPIRTGFHLPALSFLPMVRLRWHWQLPERVDCRQVWRGSELQEEVVARRRCQVDALRRRFEVFDAFGLCKIAWERQLPSSLMVLPDRGRLRTMPVVQSMVAGEGLPHPAGKPQGDRMEIRRYVPGDSVRNILWKTFARTRELNVRIPERSLDPGRKTVAYLLSDRRDEAAAAAARVALESGALGDHWMFGADGTPRPTEHLGEAMTAIARSGSLRPLSDGTAPRGDLRRFLEQPEVQDELSLVIFAAASDGPWLRETADAARIFAGGMTFVLATDGIETSTVTPLWRRMLYRPSDSPGIGRQELSRLVRQLTDAGHSALVVDRRSGRSFGGHRLATSPARAA